MKKGLSTLMRRVVRSQAGFTLAELLVVVGIIVGLAAVILPNIGRFTGSGATGASAAEFKSVQTAMDTYMADTALATVTANDLGTAGTSSNNFTATGFVDLTLYLRLPGTATQTNDTYCWDTVGAVTEQFTTPTVCTQ